MADYHLDLYDTDGERKYIITDFNSLTYLRKVNAPGLLQVELRGDHPCLAEIQDKWQVEVWRKPEGGGFVRDFAGLIRQAEYYYGEKSAAILTCPGLVSLLAWRIVNWHANTVDRSAFTATAAETIAKTLVEYNAGSDATVANGRISDGEIEGLSVQADDERGETLDWYCAWENLLETLQKIAMIGGGDFDLVKTAANAWEFRWYEGQLGGDRRASIIFALERGNMANPQYKELRIDEKTVCIVGGKGEETDRETAVKLGENYSSANSIEMFINATDCETLSGLSDRGATALRERRATKLFSFDVLQTPATQYGLHYQLGDLVTAINPFDGSANTLKVDEVSITVNEDGSEKIDVRMASP